MSQRPRRRITSAKREQIELDQKLLSKQIIRPFDVISDLPVSYNEPPTGHYEDVLKNALTVKDSGSFYMSLIKSRQNYIYTCPMFPLFWQKQSSYARKIQNSEKQTQGQNKVGERPSIISSDVNAREAMVKLCDASLSLGPHEFDIRVFIAKDERSEPPKKEDSNNNEESKGIQSSSNKDAKDYEKTKMPIHTSNDTGDKDSGTKIQDATNKNDGSSSIRERNDLKGNVNSTSVKDTEKDIGEEEGLGKDTYSEINENKETRTASEKESFVEENINTKDAENVEDRREGKENNTADQVVKTEEKGREESHVPGETMLGEGLQNQHSRQSEKDREEPLSEGPEEQHTSHAPGQEPQTESTAHLVTPSPDPKMQSIENAIMISNLNAVARFDPSLNMLMKVVALGNASPQQILAFQGYIHRAREMGPGPQHAYLFPNGQIPDIYRVSQKRPVKEKRKTKNKVIKEQKLTTFQEKYLDNATLLFEFAENPNVRYMLPKEAIGEVLPAECENSGSEVNNVLVSFLWIHNQKELDRYRDLVKEYEEHQKEIEKEKEKEKREKDAEKDNEGGVAADNEIDDVNGVTEDDKVNNKEGIMNKKNTKRRVRTRNTRNNAQNLSKKRKIEKKVPPVEPEIQYTEVSFTIRNIVSKFVPIIMNSFRPLEETQQSMAEILKKGVRTASYYIWYQIDGKLDEELAERLRCQLNQEERKMPGVGVSSNSSTSAYQRKRREKIKEAQSNRAKTETDGI